MLGLCQKPQAQTLRHAAPSVEVCDCSRCSARERVYEAAPALTLYDGLMIILP